MKIFRQGKIAVTAPSLPSAGERELKVRMALQYLEQQGGRLKIGESVFSSVGYKSASRKQRAEELMRFFLDPEVSLILTTTGGFSSNEILELLDYELIAKNPKWFVGYSDITAINLALFSRSRLCTVNGAMLVDYLDDRECFKTLDLALSGGQNELLSSNEIWETGRPERSPAPSLEKLPDKLQLANGFAVCGNLSTFNLLLATQYFPELEGAVLFLEYDKEEAHALPAIERMLWQLRLAGCFSKLKGLVFGVLEQSVREEEVQFTSLRSILTELLEPYSFPVIINAMFGHVYPSRALVNGQSVEIEGCSIRLGKPRLSF